MMQVVQQYRYAAKPAHMLRACATCNVLASNIVVELEPKGSFSAEYTFDST